jgi:ABC-type Fe3+ transport system permease subunit
MITLLILIIVFTLFLFFAARRQSRRQHRSLMQAINPQELARQDERQRKWEIVKGFIAIVVLVSLYLFLYQS